MSSARLLLISLGLSFCAALPACDDPAPPPPEEAPPLRTRVSDEPPGASCPHGGRVVVAGSDGNRNGELDNDEIERTDYVCSDAEPAVVSRLEPEPAGSRCRDGGMRTHVGRDDDRDSVLDDAEIDETLVTCQVDAIWRGDLFLTGDDELDERLEDLRAITGSVTIQGRSDVRMPALEFIGGDLQMLDAATVELPALRMVAGRVEIQASFVEELALDALVEVGRSLELLIDDSSLDLTLPNLATVGDTLLVAGAGPRRLALPALARTNGSVQLAGDTVSIELPALSEVGGDVEVLPTAAMTHLDLTGLVAIERDLVLGGALSITELPLPALTTVGGSILVGALDLKADVSDVELEALALPSLASVGGAFSVVAAPRLASIAVDELASVTGGVRLRALPALISVDAPALTTLGSESLDGMALEVRATGVLALAWPALATVDGAILIDSNTALTASRWPLLTSVRVFEHLDNGALVEVAAPALDLALTIRVRRSPALALLDLRTLRKVGILTLDQSRLSNLSGLTGLRAVAVLTLIGHQRLRDLAGLGQLELVGDMTLAENAALVSLTGLQRIERFEGRLTVTANPTLPGLPGLDRVIHIGALVIDSNPALTALTGLSNLRSIGDTLRIVNNPALRSVGNLMAIRDVAGEININDNGSLPMSELVWLMMRLGRSL